MARVVVCVCVWSVHDRSVKHYRECQHRINATRISIAMPNLPTKTKNDDVDVNAIIKTMSTYT